MAPAGMPLNLGTPQQFAALRELLEHAGFSESAVCARMGIPSFNSFGMLQPGLRLSETLAAPLDAYIRLYVECEPILKSELESLIGLDAVGLLKQLGLLEPTSAYPPEYLSPVGMCPTRGLFLASDRGGRLGTLTDDVVYPAILSNAQDFLDIIPSSPCKRFLDLGAGTGVAALVAARGYAEHAWASDIAARSVYFSEFNRQLNGLENVTACCGDLYAPVEGLTFDRIVTHPPYVPASTQTHIFRDGGDDGESIIHRAVAGLPRVLAPGGCFYAQVLVSDREGDPAEDRIRSWLGGSHPEFDVAVIAETSREPHDFIGRAMQKGAHRPEELQYWASVYRAVKAQFLVYGSIVIQRHASPRAAFTLRLQKGSKSGPAETQWALDWNTAARQAGWEEYLLRMRPACSPHLRLAVMNTVRDGVLVPQQFLLRVNYPFEIECRCPAWVARMVQLADGARSGFDLLEAVKNLELIDPATEPGELADVLRMLIGSGFLEVPEHALPQPGRQAVGE